MTRKKIAMLSDRAIRAMSYQSREARFRQEKDRYILEHPAASAREIEDMIKFLADKWKV